MIFPELQDAVVHILPAFMLSARPRVSQRHDSMERLMWLSAVDERQRNNKRRTFKPFIAVCTAVTGSSAVGIFAMCNVREEQGDTQA